MRKSYKNWKRSTLTRLIISFILILFPIYVLSIIIYDWGITTLRTEISQSMVSQVSFYLNELESEIQRIQILQYNLLNDENLVKLATISESLNDIEKMQCVLRLQQQLTVIENSSAYISDIYALLPGINKEISAAGVSMFDWDEYVELKYDSALRNSQMVNLNNKILLNAEYPFHNSDKKKKPLFIVDIEISEEKIEETLHSMLNDIDDGIIFINPSIQYTIATEYNLLKGNEIQKFIYSNIGETTGKIGTVAIDGENYIVACVNSDFLGSALCKYIPEDSIFAPLKRYQTWFILFVVAAFVIIFIYSFYVYTFIHKPLNKLVKAFRQVENEDLSVNIEHGYDDEFRYIYRRFNKMVEKLDNLVNQVYKQELLMHKIELKQLQSQINPHFLYNSFFILNTMSRIGDYDNLERFTVQLGEYFRFITRDGMEEVPLLKEVNHARVYTDIQAMRFSNRIRVEFGDLPKGCSEIMVPRLIIQPIIENAFGHGLDKKSENGLLIINFNVISDDIYIIIEDNGGELDDENLKNLQRRLYTNVDNAEVTGIINIHQRIQLKFGEHSGLKLTRSELGGLKVTIIIKSCGA